MKWLTFEMNRRIVDGLIDHLSGVHGCDVWTAMSALLSTAYIELFIGDVC
jgi:hypothetical protein